MFDDKPTNLNQVPQNLPTGKNLTSAKVPEDILSEIDSAEAVIKGPAKPMSEPRIPVPPAITPPEKPVSKEPFFKAHKKAFMIIIIVLLGGTALAIGGWYGYKLVSAPPSANAPTGGTNQGGVVNTNQPSVDSNLNQGVDTNQAPPPVIDTDRDGLPDEEEAMYGTNPNEVDSDQDGLTDRDEVKVFKTDPNNPDTDGDTYLDGNEVRGGYDPKGPGKLLKIE